MTAASAAETGASETAAAGGSPRARLIIDCDPGHDDAVALLTAARFADVVGVTTVAGNAPLAHTTHNALVVCDLAGLGVPVHAGADRPLVAPPRHAEAVHGHSGLDGPAPRQASRPVSGADAVGWLIETIRAEEGLWLVPLGPLTNVALALRQAPDLVGKLAGISLMGGSAGSGNRTPTAEFNIWADPEAAAVVFGSGAERLLMSGLNLTRQLLGDDALVARLRGGGEAADFVADLLGFYLGRQEAMTGRRVAPLHDVCAVLAVTHPSLFELAPRAVDVELSGRLTRGMTVVDERGYGNAPTNAEVGYRIEAASAMALVEEACRAPDAARQATAPS